MKDSLPPPEGDGWLDCAYCGERTKVSEMFQLDGFWIALARREEAVAFVREGGRLPRVQPWSAPVGSLAPGHLLRRTGRLLASGGASACTLFELVNLPTYLLHGLLIQKAAHWGIIAVLVVPAKVVAIGGSMFLLGQHARGGRPAVSQGLAAALRLWGGMALAGLLLAVLSFAPQSLAEWLMHSGDGAALNLLCLAAILACFYLLGRCVLAVAAAADQRRGGVAAVGRSWALTKGRFWRTLAMVAVPSLCMTMVLHMLVSSLYHFTNQALEIMPATSVMELFKAIISVGELLYVPLMAFVTCYYMELETLHEAQ